MPGNNFLFIHWQSETASLKKHLQGFSRESNGSVHKMRIHIKKLRAYIKLYVLISGRKTARALFRKTEKLFSLMGEHRNIELNKNKAKEIACGNEVLSRSYLAWLNRLQVEYNIDKAIQHYFPAGLDKLTIEMEEHLNHLSDEDVIHKIAVINEHYLKKIKRHLHHFKHNAHRVRKEFKIIFYLAKISPEGSAHSKNQVDMLNEILDDLGNIQDDKVSIEFVKSFCHSVDNEHEREILRNSRKAIEMRQEEGFAKVYKKAMGWVVSSEK